MWNNVDCISLRQSSIIIFGVDVRLKKLPMYKMMNNQIIKLSCMLKAIMRSVHAQLPNMIKNPKERNYSVMLNEKLSEITALCSELLRAYK